MRKANAYGARSRSMVEIIRSLNQRDATDVERKTKSGENQLTRQGKRMIKHLNRLGHHGALFNWTSPLTDEDLTTGRLIDTPLGGIPETRPDAQPYIEELTRLIPDFRHLQPDGEIKALFEEEAKMFGVRMHYKVKPVSRIVKIKADGEIDDE